MGRTAIIAAKNLGGRTLIVFIRLLVFSLLSNHNVDFKSTEPETLMFFAPQTLHFDDPARGRTENLTIKSRLLCQLSYRANHADGIITDAEYLSIMAATVGYERGESESKGPFPPSSHIACIIE